MISLSNLLLISMKFHKKSCNLTKYRNEFEIEFNYDEHFLNLKNYRNELEIVFGGDCFDHFASDFDHPSSKLVAIQPIYFRTTG